MSSSTIIKLLILGTIAIAGMILVQGYWVLKNWHLKDDEFDSITQIALRRTAESLAKYNNSILPKRNYIQRRSSNTYAVNINDHIDAGLLENYLISHFEDLSLNTDFEYAVYDCTFDKMVYGNYCDIGSQNDFIKNEAVLPKFKDFEYYFVVRFPNRAGYILGNLKQAIIISILSIMSIFFFVFAIIVILRQQKLSRIQRDFINNMTHEFKTPISSIKIAASSMAKNSKIKSDPKLSIYTNIVNEQSVRLNTQVEKLLNFAALEKDGVAIALEEIHLNTILEDIIEVMKIRIENKNGHFEFIGNHEVYVEADKVHLTNIIYNLTDNAIKYNDNAPKIKFILQPNALLIEDNGIGIAEEHQKSIFEKFFRVHTGDVHNVKGFGLGLYYVRTIIKKFNWKIKIDSELGKGTVFKLLFTPKKITNKSS